MKISTEGLVQDRPSVLRDHLSTARKNLSLGPTPACTLAKEKKLAEGGKGEKKKKKKKKFASAKFVVGGYFFANQPHVCSLFLPSPPTHPSPPFI